MKKTLGLALAISFVCGQFANAALFEDKCNPTPKCEPECFGCAPNIPEPLVRLEPCAKKDLPYNYYTFTKVNTKMVPSGRYDWAASPEQAQ